jgi:hypothetical protein
MFCKKFLFQLNTNIRDSTPHELVLVLCRMIGSYFFPWGKSLTQTQPYAESPHVVHVAPLS